MTMLEEYRDCDASGCVYEGTVDMTLTEVDGFYYCSNHAPAAELFAAWLALFYGKVVG